MSTFIIPEPRMPTLEEHRAASAAWLKRIGPCLYENWPDALKAISFRTTLVELTAADQAILRDLFDNRADEQAAHALADRITDAIRRIDPEGCFAKLSSRSPKDTFFPDIPRFRIGQEILGRFMESERILDDLVEYNYADAPCYLLLREFQAIPQHEEWRCFIRSGEVVGITQYHYCDFFPQLVAEKNHLADRIHQFLAGRLLPILHLDTVVVDIWLCDQPMVIEINPYGQSDPCLLNYEEMENATGLFRIVEVVGAAA